MNNARNHRVSRPGRTASTAQSYKSLLQHENLVTEASTLTTLLQNLRDGDKAALSELTPMIYDDLRKIARRQLGLERQGHTLQATALVHEAFVRLADANIEWQDRAHFFAIAARLMRRILTDYGRARQSEKRGGGIQPITLHEDTQTSYNPAGLLELDEALERLAAIDERKSDMLVLHFFGGMTYDEMAEALHVSTATVDRDLRFAKAWLANELADD
jgi:RNA polymerase sigma factor (TIGR02999 family)